MPVFYFDFSDDGVADDTGTYFPDSRTAKLAGLASLLKGASASELLAGDEASV